MILIILLLVLTGWAIVATAVELRRDGYRRTPTDPSRLAGRDIRQHADPGHLYH